VTIPEVDASTQYSASTDVHGRATLEVHQRYRYTYTQPVDDLRHRLIVVPPDVHGDQRLIAFELNVHGAASAYTAEWLTDGFGNRVCRVHAPRVDEGIEFETMFCVRRTSAGPPLHLDRQSYLTPTPLTKPSAELGSIARDLNGSAERAFSWASKALAYEVGATNVRTSASEALTIGRGVCQDFTHVLLSLLRLMGIPARYVSGHLLGEGVPHAWVEALVNEEVIAYDPTHGCRTGPNYITVAVGRDFLDVTPTSGTFRGAVTGALSATKAARVVGAHSTETEAVA